MGEGRKPWTPFRSSSTRTARRNLGRSLQFALSVRVRVVHPFGRCTTTGRTSAASIARPRRTRSRRCWTLATLPPDTAARVDARARTLVRAARAAHRPGADVTDFLAEYGLGTAEGVALLCLAEALLRIPDAATADALIEDRIAAADWQRHLGHGDSLAVNASAWAFMLTGRVLTLDEAQGGIQAAIGRMIRRLGEPVIRTALRRGMRVLARQFVMGRTIEEALARATTAEGRRSRYSFDMLGEAAKTPATRNAIGAPISMRSARSAARRAGAGRSRGRGSR